MWQYGGVTCSGVAISGANNKEGIGTITIIFKFLYPQCLLINGKDLACNPMVMIGEAANVLLPTNWNKKQFIGSCNECNVISE